MVAPCWGFCLPEPIGPGPPEPPLFFLPYQEPSTTVGTASDVLEVLADLFTRYGPPQHLRSDNGPEFTAHLIRQWLARLGVQTLYIEPGSPWENGYNESFNGKLRDEFLNGEIFYTLPEAAVLVEQWRRMYNTVRPHSAYGGLPPAPETIKPSAWFLRMPQLLGPPVAQGLT